MDPLEKFRAETQANISRMAKDPDLHALSRVWTRYTGDYNYTYNFSWAGVPIIQLPQDIVAMQELIWRIKPDLVIETGVAHGGSLILSASQLMQLDYCDAAASGRPWDTSKPARKVLGIDIEIRAHNRRAIESHPLARYIEMVEGSSIAEEVVAAARARALKSKSVLVCLDSNHTHEHVLSELEAYAPLVTPGSYCVVFDTLIEDRPHGFFPNRPWDKGNNPKTAVWEYAKKHPEFVMDKEMENKLLITTAPDGYLKRIR